MHSPRARRRETLSGVEVHRPPYWWPASREALRKDLGGLPVNLKGHPGRWAQMLPLVLVHSREASRLAREADLIHAHWTLSGLCALPASRRWQKPLVLTVQGSDMLQAAQGLLGSWTARLALRHCDQVTALSRALADRVLQFGIPTSKVTIIPNGVDTDYFHPPPSDARENQVVFIGSLIPRKGVNYLIEAMPQVLRAVPNVQLVLVGDGPLRRELEEFARRRGLEGKVQFTGAQPPSGVRSFLQQAKVLVLPSVQEGQGVVLLEAMACGTPVVASSVDGIPDVVSSDSGRLVAPRAPGPLADAIVSLLSDPTLWARMSRTAREQAVSRFSWEKIAAKFIDLYQRLTARPEPEGVRAR
jgi:glycosyltransferase involved in cell wall biosynthesis